MIKQPFDCNHSFLRKITLLAALALIIGQVSGLAISNVAAENVTPVKTKKETDPLVKVSAYLEKDKLPAGGTCEVYLVVEVKKGWHINANPPEPDFLVPTEFKLSSGQKIALKNVRYPKPKDFMLEGFDEAIKVYEGKVGIRGTLVIPKEAGGKTDKLKMAVRFQACDDRRCLTPTSAEVVGAMKIAKKGEAVKKINEKFFKKPVEKKSSKTN